MTLTAGLSILIIFSFGLGIAKRICRNPNTPEWISNSIIGSVYLPLLTGLFALGVAFLANGLFRIYAGTDSAFSADTAIAALLAVAIALGLYWPRFRGLVFGSGPKLQLVNTSSSPPAGFTANHDIQHPDQDTAKLPREVA